MLTDVGIWLYELPKCGYFPYQKNGAPLFGGTAQTFAALQAWTNGKGIGQTSTYELAEGDEGGKAYFLGIATDQTDYLVGIWNGLPGNSNNISSVGVGDMVGAASATITPIDANRIPGFATYFWVLPAENRVACIRVKHMSVGIENLKRYISSFLKYVNPQNVVLGQPGPNGEIVVTGYKANLQSTAVVSGAHPRFWVKSIPLAGDISYISANAGSIDKVICKTTLTSLTPRDLERWQKALDLTRVFNRPPPLREEAVVHVEFPMSFTRRTLDEAITAWQRQTDAEVVGAKEDLGFHMRGGEIKWLSKSQARTAYQIDVSWIDDELVDMGSLLRQLRVHRTAVLGMG